MGGNDAPGVEDMKDAGVSASKYREHLYEVFRRWPYGGEGGDW